MNFLAHLSLSCENENLLVGNFLADFIKNKEVAQLPEAIQEGIQLHRQIDSFTDKHKLVKKGVRRLYPQHSKYAPVIVDVFYDYLLAKNWHQFHGEPLEGFAQRIYEVLMDHRDIYPPFLQKRLALMIADNWLMNYTHYEGLAFTFGKMKRRLSKPELLDGVIGSLQGNESTLDHEFLNFFPDVQQLAIDFCK